MKFIKEMIARKQHSPEMEDADEITEPPVELAEEELPEEDIISKLASIQLSGSENEDSVDADEPAVVEDSHVLDFADLVGNTSEPDQDQQVSSDEEDMADIQGIEEELSEIDAELSELTDEPLGFDIVTDETEERIEKVSELRPVQPMADEPIQRPIEKQPSSEVVSPVPSAFRPVQPSRDEPKTEPPLPSQSTHLENERPISQPKKIWDLQPDEGRANSPAPTSTELRTASEPKVVEVPAPAAGRSGRRAGRVKTRLLGFEHAHDADADPFEASAETAKGVEASFPVGWIVVVSGPGRGSSFALANGVSQIGRGEDQAIKLDFGDTSISRSSHAAIAYDNEQHAFFLGHGGKANLVRLNNRPVLTTEEVSNGDLIRIGETTLRFVALCGIGFHWEAESQDDTDDAAIA